ncbi:DUF2177 family protein [Brevundimonas sp.]
MRYIAAFVSSAVVLAVLDFIWLTTMADRLYRPILGDWMNRQVNWPPAIAFYVLFLFGVTFFATVPALQQNDWRIAAINGAVFGLVAYATYDLTNHATLGRWSTTITLADMAWGTLLACTAALAGYFGSRALAH